jgi:hypothetical protein
VANTLAYYDTVKMKTVKKFYSTGPLGLRQVLTRDVTAELARVLVPKNFCHSSLTFRAKSLTINVSNTRIPAGNAK